MPRIVGSTSTHSALPDVTIDQHHARDHGPAQHSTGANILDKVVATTTVTTTAAETDLYRKTIAANTIGANGVLRLSLRGTVLQNQGAGDSWRIRVKFGATTILDTTVVAAQMQQSANTRYWRLDVMMWNAGATNAQRMTGTLWVTGQYNASFVITAVNAAQDITAQGDGTAAEDSTLAKDLAVTVTMGTAIATFVTTAKSGLLELVT